MLAAFAVAALALVLFLVTQAKATHPMVPLELFWSRAVVITVATGFAFMVGYYGLPFVFSLYFQQVRGLVVLGVLPASTPLWVLSVVMILVGLSGPLAVAVFGGPLADSATFLNGVHTSLLIAAAVLAVTALASLRLHISHTIAMSAMAVAKQVFQKN